MRKIYFSIFSFLLVAGLSAQVNVTYKVDVTNYAMGNDINANGIRVGGNFATYGGTTGGNAMADWTPTDANSAMTDEGNGIWSITVEYPQSSIGSEQLYKFVNGDWGTNEGTDTTLIADGGCGLDDGAGNINRTLVIPQTDLTLLFCWDDCVQCDGSEPTGLGEISDISDFSVAPNPTINQTRFNYTLDANARVSIQLFNLVGQEITTVLNSTQAPGNYNVDFDMSELESGIYIYQFRVGNQSFSAKLIKQ
ncbi:MAG: T9SS type A sorting domain-containing protein [Bacteroidota bacterium]